MTDATIDVSGPDWFGCYAEVLEYVDDSERFPGALIRLLETISPAVSAGVFMYRKGMRGLRVWADPPVVDSAEVSSILQRSSELDPFFTAFMEGRSGCLPLFEIAPPGFAKSTLYHELYVERGIRDEIVHMLRLPGDGHACAITSCPDRFTPEQIEAHKAAYPVFAAGLSHLATLHPYDEAEMAEVDPAVDGALERFGVDVLTPREAQVIHLVLRGHSNESAAHQLGISWNTVKRHRLEAYSKLKVGSQGELFYMFLRSIGLHPDDV